MLKVISSLGFRGAVTLPAIRTARHVSLCALRCTSVKVRLPGTSLASLTQIRFYSGKAPLTVKTVEDRIILVLSLYDKIDPKKLTMDSDFTNDLGLDSLDHVEVIMAIEDEFGFEIPDGDADSMKTPRDIFRYICDKEDVFE